MKVSYHARRPRLVLGDKDPPWRFWVVNGSVLEELLGRVSRKVNWMTRPDYLWNLLPRNPHRDYEDLLYPSRRESTHVWVVQRKVTRDGVRDSLSSLPKDRLFSRTVSRRLPRLVSLHPLHGRWSLRRLDHLLGMFDILWLWLCSVRPNLFYLNRELHLYSHRQVHSRTNSISYNQPSSLKSF